MDLISGAIGPRLDFRLILFLSAPVHDPYARSATKEGVFPQVTRHPSRYERRKYASAWA